MTTPAIDTFSHFMVITGPASFCYYRTTEHFDQAEEFFDNAIEQHPDDTTYLVGFEGSADNNGMPIRAYNVDGNADVSVFVQNAMPIEPDIYEEPVVEQKVKRGRGRPRKNNG